MPVLSSTLSARLTALRAFSFSVLPFRTTEPHRTALQILALGALYGLTAQLGLNYSTVASNVTLIWPPTGISLFVVLRFGFRLWPGIVIGDLIGNAGTGAPLLSVLGIAAGNIIETLVCAWLLQRYAGFHNALDRMRDALALLVLGSLCAALSAFVGPLSLVLGGVFPASLYWTVWLQWLMGDATGVVVLAPLLFAWWSVERQRWTATRRFEAAALLLVLIALCEAVFGGLGIFEHGYYPAALAIFPIAVWAALRFGLRGATLVMLIVSIAAIWGTVQGKGPFVVAAGVDSLVRWWVFVNIIAVTSLLLATARTERERAQAELARERDFVSTILDAEGALVIVLDRNGNIVRVNRALERLCGYTANRLLGESFNTALIAPEHRDKVDANAELLRLRLSDVVRYDTDLIQRNGARSRVSWSSAVVRDRQGKVEHVIVTGIDVTERTQATAALRHARRDLEARVQERTRELARANSELTQEMAERKRLEGEIIRVAEQEQMRIGQELHDGLGQHLTATAFLSEVLARKLKASARPEADDAARIEAMTSAAVSQTRLLARGLYPVELEANGLMAAVEQLGASAGPLFNVACSFECPAPVLVHDATVAIHLYRIAQEALTNAAKHSGARNVRIALDRVDDAVHLSVTDDGAGLPAAAHETDGMGLRIMRHRANLIGGKLHLLSDASGGLRVQVEVNLNRQGEEA